MTGYSIFSQVHMIGLVTWPPILSVLQTIIMSFKEFKTFFFLAAADVFGSHLRICLQCCF